MKTVILGVAAFLFTINMQAQNQNVTGVTKTTVTTVKDSDGEKKMVKTQNVNEVQNIELQDAESTELNKDVKATPTQVTSTTVITAPDGTTRTVDVDRSAYYSSGGKKYQIAVDNTDYTIMADNKKAGLLRRLSNNSYIFRSNDKTSVGYFDANGNLVLETYDDKTDKITVETFVRN